MLNNAAQINLLQVTTHIERAFGYLNVHVKLTCYCLLYFFWHLLAAAI